MSYGFAIEAVCAKGPNMPDALVGFSAGLSLLTGPSDTGKSLVVDIVNHVFGASGGLRDVTERSQYDRLLVQIRTFETDMIYTLERAWSGGHILLHEGPLRSLQEFSTGSVLKERHEPSEDTVSGFLLSLSGLLGRMIRTNASGNKDSLSFRNLPPYALVQEERIITKLSPVLSGQNTDVTKEESLFKCLLTGTDDRAIVTVPDKKERKGLQQGRQEVLDSLIGEVRDKIAAAALTEEEAHREIRVSEEALENQMSYIRGITAELDSKQQSLKELWKRRSKSYSRFEQVQAYLDRFGMLMGHYEADILRLESTQESGRLLVQMEVGPCPLCGAPPESHSHDGLLNSEDVEALTSACQGERTKIERLKTELADTLNRLGEEQAQLQSELQQIDESIRNQQREIDTELEPRVSQSKGGLEELIKRRRDAERALARFDDLRRLESSRAEFETKSKKEAEKQEFETVPPRVTDELAVIVQEILKAWNYPDIQRVVFDPVAKDIIVDGKPRGSHGKGYRALTYAAFMVGVMLYCHRKGLPHPGFVVLDSPLVTYRRPDKVETDDDRINEGMVPFFYQHLASLPPSCQVIVVENDEPPIAIGEQVSHTHFTRNHEIGRYGFLLARERSEA